MRRNALTQFVWTGSFLFVLMASLAGIAYLAGADKPGGFFGWPFWIETPGALFVLGLAACGLAASRWSQETDDS